MSRMRPHPNALVVSNRASYLVLVRRQHTRPVSVKTKYSVHVSESMMLFDNDSTDTNDNSEVLGNHRCNTITHLSGKYSVYNVVRL